MFNKILSFVILVSLIFSCNKENESESNIKSSKIDSSFLNGQIVNITFDTSLIGTDNYCKPFSIEYSTEKPLTVIGECDSTSKKSLLLNGSQYLEFPIPKGDTIVICFFLKGSKFITASKPVIIDFNQKANIGLDAVSGATYLAIDNKKQVEALSTWDDWTLFYVEILKNSSSINIKIKNKLGDKPIHILNIKTITAIINTGDYIRIGAPIRSGTGYIGNIDNIKIFNRILTNEEMFIITK